MVEWLASLTKLLSVMMIIDFLLLVRKKYYSGLNPQLLGFKELRMAYHKFKLVTWIFHDSCTQGSLKGFFFLVFYLTMYYTGLAVIQKMVWIEINCHKNILHSSSKPTYFWNKLCY